MPGNSLRSRKYATSKPCVHLRPQKARGSPLADVQASATKTRTWTTAAFALSVAAVLVVASYFTFINRSLKAPLSLESPIAHAAAFLVVDLPGRGKGLIASRDIEQGEVLIREKPLILVPSTTNASPVALIKERLSALSPDERSKFYSLSFVTPGKDPASKNNLSDDEVTLAIFQTNAISAGENVGLFPRTARLNHGCSAAFNSVYSWRLHEGTLVVHALKPIKHGEELLTTYTDTKKPRVERQHYLKNFYDFTCTCAVCSLPSAESAASDSRLIRMSSLNQAFATWGLGHIDGRDATRIAKGIWAVGEEEGYWSERGRLAADVAHVAAAHSDEQAVKAWATLAVTWFTAELGKECVQSRDMQALLSSPRSHFAWATRHPQVVGMPDVS